MPYSTRLQLEIIFPALEDFALSDDAFASYLARADHYIDARIGQKYSVPFTGTPSTPPIIGDISRDLTLVYILQRHYTQQIPNQSSWISVLRDETIETLDLLAKGNLTVTDSAGNIFEQRNDRYQLLSDTLNYTPVFDMRDIESQQVDPDRINQEEDDAL